MWSNFARWCTMFSETYPKISSKEDLMRLGHHPFLLLYQVCTHSVHMIAFPSLFYPFLRSPPCTDHTTACPRKSLVFLLEDSPRSIPKPPETHLACNLLVCDLAMISRLGDFKSHPCCQSGVSYTYHYFYASYTSIPIAI
jgi:hypothetical protein